ncbi:MAG: glycosyltransferase [Burkholderiaceae bacterium]|nr:glycosyltransferase [Burkholderiaceae bacterium]
MPPEISLITATRNAMADLPTLAAGVLDPSHDMLEWIVVDAASDDGTVAFLQGLADPRLRWLSEPDAGIYDAWNKGVDRARGRWLIFLGADDQVPSAWLRACAAAPDADLLYGDVEMRDPQGRRLGRMQARPWGEVHRQLTARLLLAHPGLAHHRRLFAQRRFDTGFRIAGDFQFLAAAGLRQGLRLPEVQAVVRLGGISNRPDFIERAYRENRRVLDEHGQRMPLADRVSWAAKRLLGSLAPGAFAGLQRLSWRLRRHP